MLFLADFNVLKPEPGLLFWTVESAIQDIENQKQAALVSLKNQAGQMAVEIAEKLLSRELGNKPEQEAYAKSLAEKINLN
jgi:F-type H+-transporting ATPase subunit b